MTTKQETIRALLDPGVIPVLRLSNIEKLIPLGEALRAGGLSTLELALTTPNALEGVRTASNDFGSRLIVGVGTVLDGATARMAILAGARFVVSPITASDIIVVCRTYAILTLCGAFTPTEVVHAWQAGADFVKVFPSEVGGANYIKASRVLSPRSSSFRQEE